MDTRDNRKQRDIPPEGQEALTADKAEPRTQKGQAPDAQSAFRTLAAFYLGYLIYQLITEISVGNVSEGTIPWIVAAIALFCAGIFWLIRPEIKRIKEVLDRNEPS